MVPRITIDNLHITIEARPGMTLLNSLLYEEQPIHTVCGGKARCGCCRVRIISDGKGLSPPNDFEKNRLSEQEREEGWRLACQTTTLRDVTIYLPTGDELDRGCKKI
jgi:ferredoxin